MELNGSAEPRRGLHLRERLCMLTAEHLVRRAKPAKLESLMTFFAQNGRPATAAQAENAHARIIASSGRAQGEYCLQRSVAIILLLASRRLSADWFAGVSHAPFAAHAWIEAAGHPIGESLDLSKFHIMVSACVPTETRREQ